MEKYDNTSAIYKYQNHSFVSDFKLNPEIVAPVQTIDSIVISNDTSNPTDINTLTAQTILDVAGMVTTVLTESRDPFSLIKYENDSYFINRDYIAMLQSGSCTGCDLRSVDLSGLDLNNVDLTSAIFNNMDLSQVNFSGAVLDNAVMSGANLSYQDLSGLSMTGVNLNDAYAPNTNLTGTQLTNSSMVFSYFKDSDLTDSVFDGSNLSGADFSNTILTGASFQNIIVDDYTTGVTIQGLNREKFSETSFKGANLTRANFKGVKVSAIDLTDAILEGVNFTGADLRNANLRDALTVNQANFDNADLSGAIWFNGKVCAEGSIGKCN